VLGHTLPVRREPPPFVSHWTRPPVAAGGLQVLLVVDSLRCGGAERHVIDLARALAEEGQAVTVACSVGGPLRHELAEAGVEVRPLLSRLVKRRFSPAFAGELRQLIIAGSFDVVHAHIHASATAAAAALAGSDLPLVVTEHTEGPWRGPGDRWISEIAYRRADHLIAVSSAIRRLLVDEFRVSPANVTYVANAVRPAPAPAPAPVPRRADGRDAPLLGCVARLAPEKGIDVFLRAAAMVAADVPDARFVVVGDGTLAQELPRLARHLGIGDRVDFLGHRTDARAVMAGLDVVAVSSLTEGSPLVALEAMAAGVPVVASACGGLPDQIRHGIDGLLVPPGDPVALAGPMVRLIRDPDLARRLAAHAHRRVLTDFSYPTMLARVWACYEAAGARECALTA
jgi:glycosyltransferase involved in cell wall biosynthesis